MAAGSAYLTLDKKGRATLPDHVREALGVGAGDFVLLEPTERGGFELLPAELVPREQLWFHHRDMQVRVAEAEADFAAGRSSDTATPEAAQSFLRGLKSGRRRRS